MKNEQVKLVYESPLTENVLLEMEQSIATGSKEKKSIYEEDF